ncbi:MAG: transglycosylase SLT domain-containing protein, partial [Oceanicaulis sp.]
MSDIDAASQLSFPPRRVIADAAQRTGADFDYLMRTAARESSFDASAKARTSSAAGLFQFIEQTWLAMLHRHGDRHGYGEFAAAIEQDGRGRFTISDPAMKARVLDLRFEPEAASVMAGELAAENAGHLRAAIGREPSSGELY